MSYAALEVSKDSGAPIEFYKFEAPAKTYLYHGSDLADEIKFRGLIYKRNIIARENILIGAKSLAQTIDLKIPLDCELAIDHAFLQSPASLRVEINRAHYPELTSFRTIWQGRAVEFNYEKLQVVIKTQQGVLSRSQNRAMTTLIKTTCNHDLYDEYCRVNPAAHTTVTHVTGRGPGFITVADDGVANNLLKAGDAVNQRTGERRMIVSNMDDVLGLNVDFTDLEIGDVVTLRKGCLLTPKMCHEVFNNARNFGGFSFVPADM